MSFKLSGFLLFWNLIFGGTPSSRASMMIGLGSSGNFGAVGTTTVVTIGLFMALNSPHQSSSFIVGQQLGLLLGGYLLQVLSALKNWQSLQRFITFGVPSQPAEPAAAESGPEGPADSAKDRCS